MVKISREEKKLLNVALIIAAGITVFLVFFYIPKSKAVARVKSKVEKSDALLADVRSIIGDYVSLEEGVLALRKQAAFLTGKYIDQKDIPVVLNRLSEAAQTAGVRITSMSPQSPTPFSPKGAAPSKYFDKMCLRQPVKLVLEGKYEQLANYLYLLENSPIGIYTIDGFTIRKEKDLLPELRMELVVGVYIFGQEKSARKI